MKTIERYSTGTYNNQFGDADFKSRTLLDLLKGFPEIATSFKTYADVGCGDGTVFVSILQKLPRLGCHLKEAVGYDISPPSVKSIDLPPGSQIVQADFLSCSLCYDLVTLIDVIEHVLEPQEYLRAVAKRSRFVLLHIPLDDRLSVTLTQQWNYRLQDVGHLSFWNPASAITMLTSAGLEPLGCLLTPGFLAPSGRVRLSQKIMLPLRWLAWRLNPGFTAATIGGVSLAVLCRSRALALDDGSAST